jgi:phosphoadenosine phosphosulfate reductase
MSDLVARAAELAARHAAEASARVCVTCSFQAEDMVVLDLLRRVRPDAAVLFLDTGYHFEATLAYRDRMAAGWALNLVNLAAPLTVVEQESAYGKLYLSDPARCCALRKVAPLGAGLEGYDVWFTGLRREQSPTRAGLQERERHRLPSGREILKLSPLASWTWRDVEVYAAVHEIPLLPLYGEGYLSIGCEPCTAKPEPGAHARSGRWGGAKLECGIHTFTAKEGG